MPKVWHKLPQLSNPDFETEFHHARKEQAKEMKIMVEHKPQDVECTVAEEAAAHATLCVGAHAQVHQKKRRVSNLIKFMLGRQAPHEQMCVCVSR